MLEGGFILLHRSILRWEWYGDLNTARLFIHLLLTVNYEPQRWQGIAVERGQRVASLAKLADETGLTVKHLFGKVCAVPLQVFASSVPDIWDSLLYFRCCQNRTF